MTAEGRADRAIMITRTLLPMVMADPKALIVMASSALTPDDIEDTISEILEYLLKTSSDANKEALGK